MRATRHANAKYCLADKVSDAEVLVQLRHVGLELGVGDHVDHAPVFHDVVPVRDGSREVEILFDQQYREPSAFKLGDGSADLLNDYRREPLGGFIEQQQPRAGAQYAPDRQHLLLAPGKLGALAREPLLQIWEQREDLLEGQTAILDLGRQQKVLFNVKAGKNPPLLGTQRNPKMGNPVRWQAYRLHAVERDRALPAPDDAHDRLHGRRLAGTVATEERHHLAGRDVERHAVQDVRLAVPGVQLLHREQRNGVGSLRHARLRGRPG